MSTYISDNNPNDKRGLDDLQWVNELYAYLQNEELPEDAGFKDKTSGIKLDPEQAMRVIWFLQEHLRILPDHIEQCGVCSDLYDSHSDGEYLEEPYEGVHCFCGTCKYNIPDEYFNED
jgi:hypothetical protein